MPVNQEVIDLIKSSNNDEDLSDFLQGLNNSETKVFWEWFKENAAEYNVSQIVFDFKESKCIIGNCYDNAQVNALKFGLDYCEGVFLTGMSSSLILHGFNIKDGRVIDLTITENADEFLHQEQSLPDVYFGVVIPGNFIKAKSKEASFPKNNPLLVKYFKEVNSE